MNVISNASAFFETAFAQMPEWLGWLAYVSIVASVVALLACAFQKLTCRKVSARLIYVVWILVCLRFVLVSTPESPMSFLNLFRTSSEPIVSELLEFDEDAMMVTEGLSFETEFEPMQEVPFEYVEMMPVQTVAVAKVRDYGKMFWATIAFIWLAVVAVLLLRLLCQAIGVVRLVRNSASADSNELQDVFETLKQNPNVKPSLLKKIRISEEVEVPATVGLFRPSVLLPSWCVEELTTKQLELVIVHELIHVRRRDVLIQFLSHIVMTLHWFNPVARYVRNRIEEFREITCDQKVIETCGLGGVEGTRLYAETILHFVDRATTLDRTNNQPEWIPGFVGGKKNFIRERILMMDQKKSNLARVAGLVCVVGLVLVGFTSAQSPSSAPVEVIESQKPIGSNGEKGGVTIQLPVLPLDTTHSVVKIPAGGVVLTGGHKILSDGTMWVGGKMIRDQQGRRLNQEGEWVLPKNSTIKPDSPTAKLPLLRLPLVSKTDGSQVVSVPDGGSMLIGNNVYRPDGTVWSGGKMIRDKQGRSLNEKGEWVVPKTYPKPDSSGTLFMMVTPEIQIQEEIEEEVIDLPLLPNKPAKEPKAIWFDNKDLDAGIGFPTPKPYLYSGTRTIIAGKQYKRIDQSKTDSGGSQQLNLEARQAAWPKPFPVTRKYIPQSANSVTTRKVRFLECLSPVNFDPTRIVVDGGYRSNRLSTEPKLEQLTSELEAIYEFEVYQGRKEDMQRVLEQVIHPNSMKRKSNGDVPRIGMMGLDAGSWGNGKKNADDLLLSGLVSPKSGFKKVSNQAGILPTSNESIRLVSDEKFTFKGKKFKQGVETEFNKDYSVGSSIQISPMLKAGELSSVIRINNVSLSSVLREHIQRSQHHNSDWHERPYLAESNALQAITVPVGSRFMIWSTGTFQDSSAKKLAEDDALIVLVKPKLIRRNGPIKIEQDPRVAKAQPIPTVVEGKLTVPAIPGQAGQALSNLGGHVVRATHTEKQPVEELLTPAEIKKRLNAKAFRYEVQIYEVRSSELDGLLATIGGNAAYEASPYSGLTLREDASELYVNFHKRLEQLAGDGTAKLMSKPNLVVAKGVPGSIQIGSSHKFEKGRIENGIMIKEGFGEIQLGHKLSLHSRVHPKKGTLVNGVTFTVTKLGQILLISDEKGKYAKRPQIMETEMSTTSFTQPNQTTVLKGVSWKHSDDKKLWTAVLLIKPSIVE